MDIREESATGRRLVDNVKRLFKRSFVLGPWRASNNGSRFDSSRTIKGRTMKFTVREESSDSGCYLYVYLTIKVGNKEVEVTGDKEGWVYQNILLRLQNQNHKRWEKLEREKEGREKVRWDRAEKREKKFVRELIRSF